jgi:hypothetical protein
MNTSEKEKEKEKDKERELEKKTTILFSPNKGAFDEWDHFHPYVFLCVFMCFYVFLCVFMCFYVFVK